MTSQDHPHRRRVLARDTRGANLVEYVIAVGVVALVALVAVRIFGVRVDAKIRCFASVVAGGSSSSCSGNGVATTGVPDALGGTNGANRDGSGVSGVGSAADEPTIDPAADAADPTYTTFNGPLFSQGKGDKAAVDPSDIQQGQGVEDCYLLSSMAAVAQRNPDAIRDMFKDNKDGTYTVRFHNDVPKNRIPRDDPPWWPGGVGNTHDVTISNKFPTAGGNTLYQGTGDNGETWAMALEKAYAEDHGGYAAIVHRGYSLRALKALTGHDATVITPGSSDWTFEEVDDLWKHGDAITVSSWPNGRNNALYGGDNPLAQNHAYYVTAIDEVNRTITVRNPWGWTYPPTTVSWDQFAWGFCAIQAAQVDGAKPPDGSSSSRPWWRFF